MLEPLPYRVRIRKRSQLTLTGSESIESRLEGMLHLEEGVLIFEWQLREKVERFGFEGIGTEHEEFAPEALEVPAEWIAHVRKMDLLVATWISFRARRLDAFSDIPGADGASITIRIPFWHRRLIAPFLAALEAARTAAPFRAPEPTRRLPATPAE